MCESKTYDDNKKEKIRVHYWKVIILNVNEIILFEGRLFKILHLLNRSMSIKNSNHHTLFKENGSQLK